MRYDAAATLSHTPLSHSRFTESPYTMTRSPPGARTAPTPRRHRFFSRMMCFSSFLIFDSLGLFAARTTHRVPPTAMLLRVSSTRPALPGRSGAVRASASVGGGSAGRAPAAAPKGLAAVVLAASAALFVACAPLAAARATEPLVKARRGRRGRFDSTPPDCAAQVTLTRSYPHLPSRARRRPTQRWSARSSRWRSASWTRSWRSSGWARRAASGRC